MRNWIGRALTFAALLLVLPTSALADNIVFQIIPGSGQWGGGNAGNSYAGWTGTAGDIIEAYGVIPSAVCAGPGCNPYPGNVYNFGSTTWLYFSTSGWTGSGSGTVADPYVFTPGGAVYVYDSVNIYFLGTFTNAQMVNDSSAGGNTVNFSGNFVAGTIDPAILAALGFPTSATDVVGSITATFQGNLATGYGTTDTAGLSVTPIPEPGTLALFGTGLIGVAGLIRRKLSA